MRAADSGSSRRPRSGLHRYPQRHVSQHHLRDGALLRSLCRNPCQLVAAPRGRRLRQQRPQVCELMRCPADCGAIAHGVRRSANCSRIALLFCMS
jgi:hypothetical protein